MKNYKEDCIDEAKTILATFACVKDENNNYALTNKSVLINCCKAHVNLLHNGRSVQEYIDALLDWLDNI